MPIVFASVSVTIILFYLATLGLAYSHLMSAGSHMLLGLFMTTLMILLQCLIFGFFIGSGKSIKRVVQDNGLSPDWIQKTKDYKNRSYPALMLALLASAAAGIIGGGVLTGAVPVWIHQLLVWAALLLNARSLWLSYKVIVENVQAIHRINGEINALQVGGPLPVLTSIPPKEGSFATRRQPNKSPKFFFLAAAVWVPYLYMRFSLGSRTFPFWPFLSLSVFCLLLALVGSRKPAQG
jgi:hypothetical protein